MHIASVLRVQELYAVSAACDVLMVQKCTNYETRWFSVMFRTFSVMFRILATGHNHNIFFILRCSGLDWVYDFQTTTRKFVDTAF